MRNTILKIALVFSLSAAMAGCTVIFQTGRRSDTQKIEQLQNDLNELKQARVSLEDKLRREINDKNVKLEMMEKGLVITFLADIMFDSGKAKIRSQAYNALNKIAEVLKADVPNLNVGIEGHTDNIAIKYSNWKSNWELSTSRALSVLHYLADKEGISPDRLSAIGYGEFRPVASNDTREGRKLNRRVEIVILPQLTKVKGKEAVKEPELIEPQENLK